MPSLLPSEERAVRSRCRWPGVGARGTLLPCAGLDTDEGSDGLLIQFVALWAQCPAIQRVNSSEVCSVPEVAPQLRSSPVTQTASMVGSASGSRMVVTRYSRKR